MDKTKHDQVLDLQSNGKLFCFIYEYEKQRKKEIFSSLSIIIPLKRRNLYMYMRKNEVNKILFILSISPTLVLNMMCHQLNSCPLH